MNQTAKQLNSGIGLLIILAFLVVARISCPALSNIPIFTVAFTFLYGAAFLGIFLLTSRYVTKTELVILLLSALYTMYMLLRSIMSGNGLFATDAFNAYIIIFLVVIYIWVTRQPAGKQKALLNLIFAALIFDYAYSIWVLTQDPNASRIAATGSVLEKSPYDVINAVGNFDAVYGGISVVTILLCMLQNAKRGALQKCLLLVILALAFVFIFMASYATALVLLLFAVALVFASRNRFFAGLLVTSLALILICHEAIGQWIAEQSVHFSNMETLQKKIIDFGQMLKTFETAGTYDGSEGRLARMQWSLDTFKQYPIFGGHGVSGAKIGGHSELLDMLGKYGIVGFGLLAAFLVTLYKDIQKKLHTSHMKKCCNIVFFVWSITAVLNPALYSLQMMPIILMLPLANSYGTNKAEIIACNEQENLR